VGVYLVLSAVYCGYLIFECYDVPDIVMSLIDSPYYTRKPSRSQAVSQTFSAPQQQVPPVNPWLDFILGDYQYFHGTDTLQAALDIYYNQRFKINPERHYTGLYMTKVIEKAVFYATYKNDSSPGYILILGVAGLSDFFINSDQISANDQYFDWTNKNGFSGDSMSRFVLSLGKRVVDNGWEKILVAPVVQGSRYVKVEGLSVVAVFDTKRNFVI
jgi:hypothetical protein